MAILKKATAYTRMFLMVQSADHVTGLSSATTPTVTISKAGAAFGSPVGSVTVVSSGWSSIALTSGDTDTLGDLAFHCTASGADPTDFADQIFTRTNDDFAYPATTGRSIVVDAAGLVDANVVKLGPSGSGTAQTARDVGSSVLLSSGTGAGQILLTSGQVTATNASTAPSITIGSSTMNDIADAFLDRNMATGTDSGSSTFRTPRQALRFLRNKWTLSGASLTVYKEDDATATWTSTMSQTAGINPVTGSDPAGP